MSIFHKLAVPLCAAISCGLMATAASAIELQQSANGGFVTNQQLQNQQIIQQNEQMRQNYQLQQKLYREQDRPRVTPQQMDVPSMRPNCVPSGYPPSCR